VVYYGVSMPWLLTNRSRCTHVLVTSIARTYNPRSSEITEDHGPLSGPSDPTVYYDLDLIAGDRIRLDAVALIALSRTRSLPRSD
jgi:hypothetical protein